MDRVDLRLARITGQTQRPFEIVVADDDSKRSAIARLLQWITGR